MSVCFLVPVKIDHPDQEFYVKRCIEGIRQVYPNTLIVLVTAQGTRLTLEANETTKLVENPFHSVYGAIYLFYLHRYADYAYVLHDSMTVVRPLPPPSGAIRFLYSFPPHYFNHGYYMAAYKTLLSEDDIQEMMKTLPIACFGCACLIRHDAIEAMRLLDVIPNVSSKYTLEAMERVFAYLAFKHCLVTDPPTICGDIFEPTANPWGENKKLQTATLEQLRNFPHCIFKSIVSRG